MIDNKDSLTNEEREKVLDAKMEDTITKGLAASFNLGIEAALIEVYEKQRIYLSLNKASRDFRVLECLFDELIAKLRKLKKKP